MRRLARHLFTTLSAISLLLCVAVCAEWVRSYVGSDYAARLVVDPSSDDGMVTHGHSYQVTFMRGSIRLSREAQTGYRHVAPADPSASQHPAVWSYGHMKGWHPGWENPPARSVWNRLGFYQY